ncbi:MAG: carbonic anhydrase [Desulfobacteraceae bacterium]|nr:carbonic anhydrase [Desulfobacteraceae bacterium]
MKKKCLCLIILITGVCFSVVTFAGEKVHWGYSGHEGPKFWGNLAPEYTPCAEGRNQSPIDIAKMIESDLPPLAFNYQAGGTQVINNGHTIQVNYNTQSSITIDGISFELKQFHFHSPSENIIEGKSFPMEAHFVHADNKGALAVVALMFETSAKDAKNNELEKAWAQMPAMAGGKAALVQPVDANLLLPKDRSYYRFNGSLTTPPCSEGVRWLVMKSHVTAAKAQIDKFKSVVGHPNNRPVQPVNARMILE